MQGSALQAEGTAGRDWGLACAAGLQPGGRGLVGAGASEGLFQEGSIRHRRHQTFLYKDLLGDLRGGAEGAAGQWLGPRGWDAGESVTGKQGVVLTEMAGPSHSQNLLALS